MSKPASSLQMPHRALPMASILLAHQLVLFPLYFFVPFWIAVLNCIAAVAVLYVHRTPGATFNRWLKVAITLLAILGVFLAFRKFAGRDAGVALITAMYGLKIMEVNRRRDAYLILGLGFFVLVAGFLFSQKPLIAFYQVIPILALLNAFMSLNRINPQLLNSGSFSGTFRDLGKYLMIAIPVMVIMFVFFPRLSGPLWRMPGAASAASGVSDTMSPGDIGSLQLFENVAFRVSFEGDAPVEKDHYWRMLALDEFDGFTWSRSGTGPIPDQAEAAAGLPQFSYTVTMEPSQLNYLVMLDRPIVTPRNGRLLSDFTTYTRFPVFDRTRYTATSAPQLELDSVLSRSDRNLYTRLPDSGNSRSKDWANSTREALASDWEFIRLILSRINQQEYYYTLQPPTIQQDTVDSFFFDIQQGFCEHYAGALVFLARAAGIPARVVVGYQGAEKNPLSNYWIVRYANAHAWTEIWIEGRGWVRVDPTAAIAESRIEDDLLQDYLQRESLFDSYDVVDLDNLGAFKQFQYWMDQMDSNWNDWILDYNSARQSQLLGNLGFKGLNSRDLIVIMLVLVTGFMTIASLRYVKRRQRKEPLVKAFSQLLEKLRKRGVSNVSQSEGPRDLADRLGQIDKVAYAAYIDVLSRYIQLRYQESFSETEYRDLIKSMRQL